MDPGIHVLFNLAQPMYREPESHRNNLLHDFLLVLPHRPLQEQHVVEIDKMIVSQYLAAQHCPHLLWLLCQV